MLDHGFLRARPLAGGLEEWVRSGRRIDHHATSTSATPDESVADPFGSKYGP